MHRAWMLRCITRPCSTHREVLFASAEYYRVKNGVSGHVPDECLRRAENTAGSWGDGERLVRHRLSRLRLVSVE